MRCYVVVMGIIAFPYFVILFHFLSVEKTNLVYNIFSKDTQLIWLKLSVDAPMVLAWDQNLHVKRSTTMFKYYVNQDNVQEVDTMNMYLAGKELLWVVLLYM